MAQVLQHAVEVRDHVEGDSSSEKKYVKEMTIMVYDLIKATGGMFEQECLRMINMVSAIIPGGAGGSYRTPKGIFEHRVIQNLGAVSGGKELFRQWHQKFIAALGQVRTEYEEIVHRLAKEVDLGRET